MILNYGTSFIYVFWRYFLKSNFFLGRLYCVKNIDPIPEMIKRTRMLLYLRDQPTKKMVNIYSLFLCWQAAIAILAPIQRGGSWPLLLSFYTTMSMHIVQAFLFHNNNLYIYICVLEKRKEKERKKGRACFSSYWRCRSLKQGIWKEERKHPPPPHAIELCC